MDINSLRVRDDENGERRLADLGRWRESNGFSAAERLALELAERMTITGERVDNELLGRLKAHYDEPQIVELTAAIAFENFRSRLNPALGVESQGFCLKPR